MKDPLSFFIRVVILGCLTTTLVTAQTEPQPDEGSSATAASTAREYPLSEKEAAFRKFYQRDPACDSFRDDNMMDRCRFAYTEAKKEFEKIWANRNRKP